MVFPIDAGPALRQTASYMPRDCSGNRGFLQGILAPGKGHMAVYTCWSSYEEKEENVQVRFSCQPLPREWYHRSASLSGVQIDNYLNADCASTTENPAHFLKNEQPICKQLERAHNVPGIYAHVS